jgi:hypothetical protein
MATKKTPQIVKTSARPKKAGTTKARAGAGDKSARSSGANKPGASKSGASKSGASKPGARKAGTNKSGGKKPSGKKPGGKKPGGSKTPRRGGDKRTPRDRSRPAAADPNARRVIGGQRNEHGTRVSRRIDCQRCGKSDHVPWTKNNEPFALCRTCAAEVLATFEVGLKERVKTNHVDCNLCGKPFDIPVTVEDDGDLLCRSCLRGFMDWQGDLDTPYAERTERTSQPRRSGTLLRRRGAEPEGG